MHVLNMAFEYENFNLEELTKRRRDRQNRTGGSGGCYSEQELWSIMKQVLDSVKVYHDGGVHPIEDIQPCQVLVMNGAEENEIPRIKLLDSQFFSEERYRDLIVRSKFKRRISDNHYFAIFSPKELTDISTHKTQSTSEYEYDIIWSLGTLQLLSRPAHSQFCTR